jgi:hypothetical protein
MTTDLGAVQHTSNSERMAVTNRVRSALADLVTERGPQHLIVTWPPTATCMCATDHRPEGHEAIIRHVDGCPVFLDLRQLDGFHDQPLLLDVDVARRGSTAAGPRFVLRAASA